MLPSTCAIRPPMTPMMECWTKSGSSAIPAGPDDRKASQCCPNPGVHVDLDCTNRNPSKPIMAFLRVRRFPALIGAILFVFSSVSALAQGDQKGQEQKSSPGEPAKDQKKIDEFAEAIRVLGGPASNPECVWLGRRVVNLMWRDDLDTAFRHLDLYDRFGCPGGHIQAAFRCLVRQGQIDPKALESLSARVHACWINPTMDPAQAAPPAQAAQPSGTKPQ